MSWWRRIRRRGVLASAFAPMRYLWLLALRSPAGTRDLALGFAIGVFWACIPIFILHWPCALLTAGLTKKSQMAATAGVFLSNPFTIPVQYSAAWLIGHQFVRGGATSPAAFTESGTVLAAMMDMGWSDLALLGLGGLIMGVVLCVPAYFISYHVAGRVRRAGSARRVAAGPQETEER